MIEGKFGDEDGLFFEIDLIASDGLELQVDALLDTGFSGWLALDKQDLEELDWAYTAVSSVLRYIYLSPNLSPLRREALTLAPFPRREGGWGLGLTVPHNSRNRCSGKQTMRMAKGESNFDIYLGKVRIDGQEFDIPVYAGEGVTEFLLGRQWLKTKRLVVDFPSGILTLGAT